MRFSPRLIKSGTIILVLSLELCLQSAFAQAKPDQKDLNQQRSGQFRSQMFQAFRVPDYQVDAVLGQKIKEEIAILKRLTRNARDSNDRAEKLFRIAELYWLDERSTYFQEMEKYQAAMKAHIEGRLKKEPKEPKFSGRASFEIYRNIAKTAPNYSRLDEVLFLAGFHSMEINSPDAGPYFERLIKEFPKSKFLVDAHMELGEFYFQKRELDKAQANFQAVLKADNSLRNFALYKIGWCYYNRGNTKAAMKIMQRVVSSSKGVKSELELRGEALKDLIIFYSDLGLIDEARRYFTAIGEPAYARKVLERLAEIYFEQSRYEKAIEALQKLIAMEPTHPDVPRHHSRLIESYEKSEELERAMREMQVFIQSYKPGTPWYERNTDSSVREYAYNRSEGLARFLAQKYHELAQKAESKNKPASDKYTQMALQFYESYIQQFGSHKNAAEMRFLFAQLLLKNKVYAKAADQYEWIVKNDKKTPKYKDALIGLIDSLRALEDDQYKKISEGLRKNINEKATPSPYALRLLNAYNIFIARYSRDERVPDIMLNRAQIYYNYNHFDKAKPAFGQVIQKFRDHSAAHQARHAILDMYNLLKDWENLEKIASQFLKVSSFATDQNKKLLYEIIQGSIFQRAKDYEDKKQYLEAAKTYERLLSLYPTSKYSDKALFNASINYLNADENDKAIATSKKFIKTYPKSDLVPKLILALATNFDDRMDYEHAAEYYEILASQDPKSKLAPDALFNAGLYREQLKHYSIAVNNYETYLKRYPKSKDAAETAFSLGVVYEKMKAYSKAVDVFKSFPRRYPRERARIVEAYYRLGDNLNKLRDYGPAERAWKNGAAYGRKYRTGTHYAAKSQFELTKPVLREFNAVKLRMPQSVLTRAIERKANLLKNLKDSYLKIINMGDAEVGVAALYHIGYVYQDFSAALFGAPMPKGLKDNEIQIYQQELQSRAAPIEEKAIEAYENAFKKSQELQVYSTWTIKTYDALTQYKPSQYPARQGEADIVWVHNEPFARVVQKAGPPQKPDGNAKRNKVDFEELPRLRVSSARAFESAFNKSRSAIASNARNFQAYVVLGQAYFQLGEYAKAKNSFENALLVKPDRDDIKLELAKAAIEAGDSKLSLQIYRDLLKKDPDNWTLKNNLSIAYRKIRHFKSATALIREMLSSDKFHIYAINNLGLLYHDTRRYELAELTFQKGKKSNPDTAETYNNLGLTYLAMDMPSNAITEFKRAVELDRKLASAWMNLGNIYLKHANAQEAVRAYEKVVSIDPVSFEANQNLGVAYMSMKKTDKAKDAFENVLAINSNHGPALFNLGILYHQYEKNREKALEYYTRFINTQRGKLPKNHEVYAYIKQVKMMPVKTQETGTKGNK